MGTVGAVRTWFSPRRQWSSCDSLSCRVDCTGTVFHGSSMLDEGELAARLGSLPAPEEFGRFVGELNGFFACVCRFPDGVVAAVDRVRSIPLFYGEDAAGVLYLSDDARWVRARLGNSQMDEVCKAEFALTGYVTGADTLSPGVKQLQAGEMLMLQSSSVGQTES